MNNSTKIVATFRLGAHAQSSDCINLPLHNSPSIICSSGRTLVKTIEVIDFFYCSSVYVTSKTIAGHFHIHFGLSRWTDKSAASRQNRWLSRAVEHRARYVSAKYESERGARKSALSAALHACVIALRTCPGLQTKYCQKPKKLSFSFIFEQDEQAIPPFTMRDSARNLPSEVYYGRY